jgi:hypothetical protein
MTASDIVEFRRRQRGADQQRFSDSISAICAIGTGSDDPEILRRDHAIASQARLLGSIIIDFVPPGRDRALALAHVEDAVYRALKALVRQADEVQAEMTEERAAIAEAYEANAAGEHP